MRKGIVYVRVSDPGQVKGTSLDNQQKACLEYAARNDIEAVRVFVEEGESATAANRTEFLKALEFCREHRGEIQVFVVWKIDRFARNTNDHFAVRAKLTNWGVTLLSVTEPITQDPIGKLMETFLAGYAEFENEVRKQRCTGGMQGRLRDGVWCWWPPIGYTHSKGIKDRRKTLPDTPDGERFHLIQKGLRLYQSGHYSLEALTDKSNAWGLRTRTNKPMRKQLWETILANKFYAGILVDPWTGAEYQGKHEPMITLHEYEQIQLVKGERSNNATARRLIYNPDFPLRRFVLCECGHSYTASWSKGRNGRRYPFYRCQNQACGHFGRSVARDKLETSFREFLRGVSPEPGYWETFKDTVSELFREQLVAGKRERERCCAKRQKLEMQRKELLEMRINKEVSSQDFREMEATLDRQMADLIVSEPPPDDEFDGETAISVALDMIENPADAWWAMPAPNKQRFQAVILPQGITYRKTDDAFGTAILSPVFRLGRSFLNDPSGLVAGVRQNWKQILQDVKKLHAITLGDLDLFDALEKSLSSQRSLRN